MSSRMTRYVEENVMPPGMCCGRCLCGLTIIIIFFPLWVWLSVSMVDQSSINFSIQDFYIAGVKSTDSSDFNQSIIYFRLDIANTYKSMGVYYENLNLTFLYYASGDSIVPVATYTIKGFRQGRDKRTKRKDYVVTAPGITWQGICNNVSVLSLSPSVSSDVVFKVDLATAIRFRERVTSVQSKRLPIFASSKVEVDRITGKKASDNAIKLKHMIKHYYSGWLIFACIIWWLALVLCTCLGNFVCSAIFV